MATPQNRADAYDERREKSEPGSGSAAVPGRVRSVGFRESDICELIAQGAALGAGVG